MKFAGRVLFKYLCHAGGAVTLLAMGGPARAACDAAPDVMVGKTAKVALAARTVPATIKVGELFAVQAEVCPQAGVVVKGLKVDAGMPAHKHGMNYQPKVAQTGPATYNATGLMFHMPGKWQFTFDVDTAAGRERIQINHTVE